jgi:hypothetical protein
MYYTIINRNYIGKDTFFYTDKRISDGDDLIGDFQVGIGTDADTKKMPMVVRHPFQ